MEPFTFSTDRMDFIYEVLIEFKIMESSEPLQMAIAEVPFFSSPALLLNDLSFREKWKRNSSPR